MKKLFVFCAILVSILFLEQNICAQDTNSLKPIFRGDKNSATIALTFDACPNSGPNNYDETITRVLKQTNTPATIFLSGKWIQFHEEVVKNLASDTLFELENHSYSHPHLKNSSDTEILFQISKTNELIQQISGAKPKFFRCPYGEYDPRVLNIAEKCGLKTVQWSIVTGDPDKNVSAKDIIRTVLSEARNGSIIIMHINGRGWHTAEALSVIIEELQKQGFKFVTLEKMSTG